MGSEAKAQEPINYNPSPYKPKTTRHQRQGMPLSVRQQWKALYQAYQEAYHHRCRVRRETIRRAHAAKISLFNTKAYHAFIENDRTHNAALCAEQQAFWNFAQRDNDIAHVLSGTRKTLSPYLWKDGQPA